MDYKPTPDRRAAPLGRYIGPLRDLKPEAIRLPALDRYEANRRASEGAGIPT